jgi:excisionase family DNA binding protein
MKLLESGRSTPKRREVQKIVIAQNSNILMKPREVASALQVSRSQVYKLLNDGSLPSIRVGHSLRIPRQALLDWVASHTVGGTSGLGAAT